MPGSETEFIRVLRDRALFSVDLPHGSRAVDDLPAGGLTPAEIESQTGMSRPAVSNLLKYFDSVLQRQDAGGKPVSARESARRWALDPAIGIVVGIDVGHTTVSVGISDLYGRLRYGKTSSSEGEPSGDDVNPFAASKTLDWAVKEINEGLLNLGRDASEVVGVALSLGAPVDRQGGLVRAGLSLGSEIPKKSIWSDWQLTRARDQLRRRLGWHGVPFLLDNDANLSALAEHTWGAARPPRFGERSRYDNVVYLEWSQGIGAGLIIDGEIYRGRDVAGEIGHTVVAEEPECPLCGNKGCLETLAGVDAIANEAEASDFSTALEAARAGEDQSLVAFKKATLYVARALGPVIHLLDPDLVIIGGEVGQRAYDVVKDDLSERLRRYTMPPALKDAEVVRAELREGSPALQGALGLVLREQKKDPNEDPNALLSFLQRRRS